MAEKIRLTQKYTCPVCGKDFYVASWQTNWAYKIYGQKLCSYACCREYEKRKQKRKYNGVTKW